MPGPGSRGAAVETLPPSRWGVAAVVHPPPGRQGTHSLTESTAFLLMSGGLRPPHWTDADAVRLSAGPATPGRSPQFLRAYPITLPLPEFGWAGPPYPKGCSPGTFPATPGTQQKFVTHKRPTLRRMQ